MIAAERGRHAAEEGWTADHDDDHDDCELTIAAGAYLLVAHCQTDRDAFETELADLMDSTPEWWPWQDGSWKPSDDPIRNLVKAGALIAAEIDRLSRAADRGKG